MTAQTWEQFFWLTLFSFCLAIMNTWLIVRVFPFADKYRGTLMVLFFTMGMATIVWIFTKLQ